MSKEQPGSHLTPDDMAAMIDGRLGSDEHAALVHHLAECEGCREALAEYARAHSTVGEHARAWSSTNTRIWMSLAATLTLATVVGVLMFRRQPAITETAPAVTLPATSPPAAPPTAATPPIEIPVTPRTAPEDLTTRRSGTREIGGKTFRLVAGEWIDGAYDPLALLPAVDVDSSSRDAILARIPALTPYAALGPRFIVVHDGTVYRFGPR